LNTLGSERELVELLRSLLGGRGGRILTDIGDDAALVRGREGKDLVLTTDSFVEGMHYRKEWAGPVRVGERAMAAALSDIAAMAAAPVAALVSLGLPDAPEAREIAGIYEGLEKTASRHRCRIVGGETVRTRRDFIITITVMGEAEKGRALTRGGARPGDLLCVSGTLGKRQASLRCLESRCGGRASLAKMAAVFFGPVPRIEEARFLRTHLRVTSMIDTSDGLSTDLSHLLAESGAGAVVFRESLPIAREAREIARKLGESALAYALHGGEDYELLFTVKGEMPDTLRRRFTKRFGVELTCIGTITDSGSALRGARGEIESLAPRGFDHLSAALHT
jgi:thiamine-monophosphate kinase